MWMDYGREYPVRNQSRESAPSARIKSSAAILPAACSGRNNAGVFVPSGVGDFEAMNSDPVKEKASAVILTGGKSSRMGRPKALLPFDGEPLIVHLVRSLGRMFGDIVVVAAPGQEIPLLPVTVVRDEVAYQGPVGGIYYGLKAALGEVAFVSPCDVPFLDLSLVAHLLSRIADYDAVIPYWDHRLQPLPAVYRRSVLPRLREQLDRGQLRANFLCNKLRTCKVEEDEIRRFDPEGLSFLNMNTWKDYESALKRWQADGNE